MSERVAGKVCDKHRRNPARVYHQCIGCELDGYRDTIDRLTGERDEARAIIERLPKDAEGNAVYPGRELVSTFYGSIQQPRTVGQIWADGWTLGGSVKYRHDDPARPCYGSVESAEAARHA